MILILGRGCVLPRGYLSRPRLCAWKPLGDGRKLTMPKKYQILTKKKKGKTTRGEPFFHVYLFQPRALSDLYSSEATQHGGATQ